MVAFTWSRRAIGAEMLVGKIGMMVEAGSWAACPVSRRKIESTHL